MILPINLSDTPIPENLPISSGDIIISMIFEKSKDVHAFNKALEGSRVTALPPTQGVFGYTKTALKTIWAAFIYLLKRPIECFCQLFGYEPFLDKRLLTLVSEYEKLLEDVSYMMYIAEPEETSSLADFLLRIRDLANVTDFTLIKHIIEENDSLEPFIEPLLETLSTKMLINYLDTHLERKTPCLGTHLGEYFDSLGTSMKDHFSLNAFPNMPEHLIKKLGNHLSSYLDIYPKDRICKIANSIRDAHNFSPLSCYYTIHHGVQSGQESDEQAQIDNAQARIDQLNALAKELDPINRDLREWNLLYGCFTEDMKQRPDEKWAHIKTLCSIFQLFYSLMRNAQCGISEDAGNLPTDEELGALDLLIRDDFSNVDFLNQDLLFDFERYEDAESVYEKACQLNAYIGSGLDHYFQKLSNN